MSQSSMMKAIHVARRELRMERDTYIAMVQGLPGCSKLTSTADASERQLRTIVKALKAKGFAMRSGNKTKGKPHNFDSAGMPAEITKIEALLADMRLPWSYADAIANRQSKVPKMAWARDRDSIVAVLAALHVEQEKRALLATLEGILKEIGQTKESIEFQLKLPKGWQRRRKLLISLIENLTPMEEPHE